jgi:hypothetical protein
MREKISFYSERLKKTIEGSYVVERGTVTAFSAAGIKSTRTGAFTNVEPLVRRLLEDLEIAERRDFK